MSTPRLGSRDLFPDLQAHAYLNHAAVSPPSLAVRAAVQDVADTYARAGAGAWMHYAEQRNDLRRRLAALLGAASDSIGFVPNTSHGVLAVAMCFPWQRGDRVVLLRGEFPTNVTPWQRAAQVFELDLVWLDASAFAGGGDGLAKLAFELERGVRLVAVSAVQFQTGLRMPVRAMAEICHAHGAELFVDAIQAVGAVPVDVAADGVDYLAAGAHKWLMGMEGAGFLYVAPERVAALRPHLASWLSHEDATRFLFEGAGHLRYDRPLRQRADFVELGVMGSLAFAALHASVATLTQLGIATIYDHVQRLLDPLEEGLLALGFTSARAAKASQRSCVLSVVPPAGVELPTLWRALDDAGVACASPDGFLRFSPHWHNSLDDVAFALEATRRCLAR
ncbi:MAG: aminotransferase class V-fold PLP-dependent enzyme [Planctomycetota bacterium]